MFLNNICLEKGNLQLCGIGNKCIWNGMTAESGLWLGEKLIAF